MAKDWTTIQVSLDPILEPINAVIATIDSVLAFLIALLNVVQFILNVVKAFLIGLLNPIRAIIEAIIAEIRQIISDLRQAGLYLADDYNMFSVQPVNTTQDLLGGYSEYEKRMLKRLLDRTDPTRPNLSSASVVVAMFAYISAGDLFALLELIRRIRAFFGKRDPSPAAPFAVPTTPTAKLGTYGLKPSSFVGASKVTDTPDAVTLKWTMPSTGTPFAKAPKGFLVHVSTVPDGFGVRAFMPGRESSQEVENLPIKALAAVDPVDGTELRLYGGMSDLGFSGSPEVFYDSTPDEHAAKIKFSLDQNTPLFAPFDLSDRDGQILGAATYFFSPPLAGLLPAGSSYSCTLKKSDLPQAINITSNGAVADGEADTFYIRVRPVTKTYADNGSLSGTAKSPSRISTSSTWKPYIITNEAVVGATGVVLNPFAGSEASGLYGKASEPVKVSFPSASQLEYQSALKAALVVLILVRPDLVEEAYNAEEASYTPTRNSFSRGFATGLEGFGKDLLVRLRVAGGITYETAANPTSFRSKIVAAITQVADKMLSDYKPSEAILEALADEITAINDFTWDDVDPNLPGAGILSTLEDGGDLFGYANNPTGWGTDKVPALLRSPPEYVSTPTWGNLWLNRSPMMPARFDTAGNNINDKTRFIPGQGWSDFCPVLFQNPFTRGGDEFITVSYVRDLLVRADEGALLRSVSTMLQIHGSLETRLPTGQWKAIRFLDKVLKPVDTILTDVEAFLLAILDGLQGLIDKIVAYIEAIQARIYQLQALIEKIRALLRSLTLFDLPSFSGLVLVENGTDGIASALVTSGNKPTDGAGSYAAGAIVLFGGLPAVLLESIALLLGGGGED